MAKKYYYKLDKLYKSFPGERCHLKNDGTRMGSGGCTSCENCLGFDSEEKWIKCDEIEIATTKKQLT